MNLTQQKLTKSEWDYLELPVNKKELYILKFIHDSYNNLNASENPNNSLIRFLKINVEDYEDFHKYFYNKFVINPDFGTAYALKIYKKKLKF